MATNCEGVTTSPSTYCELREVVITSAWVPSWKYLVRSRVLLVPLRLRTIT